MKIDFDYAKSLRGHTAMVGTSGSGKTVVAKELCRLSTPHIYTAVLDVEGEKWDADLIENNLPHFTAKVEHLIKSAKTRERFELSRKPQFYLFVDESAEHKSAEGEQLKRWAKRIRKYGGKIFFIGQRCVDMDKGARTEAESYIVLNQSLEDVKAVGAMTNSKFMEENCTILPDKHFMIRKSRTSDIDIFKYGFDGRKKSGVKLLHVKTIQTPKMEI